MIGRVRPVLARSTVMLRLFLGVLLALTVSGLATAQEYPPRPDGPIYDGAQILSDAEEAQLDQRLRTYTQETGRVVIVATVDSLEGQDVAVYARDLAEEWDVGGAETEKAALMLVAPEDRKAWITTARGVQGRLTDAISGRIFRETMVPAFREGDYAGGISAGVERIIETLDMDLASAEAIAEAEAAAAAAGRSGSDDVTGATVIGAFVWIGLIVLFAFIFGRGKKGRRRRRYGAGSAVGEVLLWTAISSALNAGDGDGWGGGSSGGFGGGGFGGFGGGGGGFNGGGAGGGW